MENKHTPGPWKAGRPDMGTLVDGVESKWIYAGDQYVAVASGRIEGEWDEVMANAHLIAAAPDLLAAAREALYTLEKGYTTHAVTRAMLNDAIARAEGREA